MTECQRINTPSAQGTNDLLWGDGKKGNFGLMARMPDRFDDAQQMDNVARGNQAKRHSLHVYNTTYLPASFLHASLRASNGLIVNNDGGPIAGFIVGSRFRLNNKGHARDDVRVDSVDTPACYAADAATFRRNALTAESSGAKCHPRSPPGVFASTELACTVTKRIVAVTRKFRAIVMETICRNG